MDTERIREIAEQALSGTDRFVVGIRQLPSDEIEVTIDSDTTVGIDDCIALSRAVTGAFDRDAEDFALTVVSAGIGQPPGCARQFLSSGPGRLLGREWGSRSFASASTARWWGAKSMSFCVTVAS